MAKDVEIGSIGDDSPCEDETVEILPLTVKNLNGAIGYLTLKTRLEFTKLRKAFTKAPIFQYFDPKCHI